MRRGDKKTREKKADGVSYLTLFAELSMAGFWPVTNQQEALPTSILEVAEKLPLK